MEQSALRSVIESILFAAEKPVHLERFQQVFEQQETDVDSIKEALEAIRSRYLEDETSGFELREAQGGYQFCTKVANTEYVRKFLESKPFRLGRSSLEVLAIIAYRQPITRAEIDNVRGIDSSHIVRVLMEKGIVKMGGKSDIPGKPVQYTTTPKFLELVGLNKLADLPPLSELKELRGDNPQPEEVLDAGLDRFIDSQITHNEKLKEEDEGLIEIDSMIKNADGATKEVYASPVHEDIALANKEALEAFQSQKRSRTKKIETPIEMETTETEEIYLEMTSDTEPDTWPDTPIEPEPDQVV